MDETHSQSAGSGKTSYRVLARKYRPGTFDDLIGQEPMVQTLTNAFRLGRIAQAYMLTGVRGVGKTTTARILARALNYETDAVHQPTVDMPVFGVHCEAIINARHIDVFEMDAASHTGIDDIREIVDAVKFMPAAARYKVYIIDEVHMLSKSAFNGLLKTLEEPPEHVTFIFATTEIRKVPVTILSRCQRFDLRRIDGAMMVTFLEGVCAKEGVSVEGEALALIARASEGSVRDALSLLDQAIAHGGEIVTAQEVRVMLGLADRGRVIELFSHIMAGHVDAALREVRAQYDIGADPMVILADLADFTHLVTTVKLARGVVNGQALFEMEKAKAEEFAETLTVRVLSRAWQILLKGIEEVQTANRPLAATDMVIVRLAYVADLPTPDEALKMLQNFTDSPSGAAPARPPAPFPSNTPTAIGGGARKALMSAPPVPDPSLEAYQQADPFVETPARPRPFLVTNNQQPRAAPPPQKEKAPLRLNRFEDLVALAQEKRDMPLRSALENHVRLIDFANGRLEFSPTKDASPALASDLKIRLADWTGMTWSVVVARTGGAEPLALQRQMDEKQRVREAEDDPIVAAVLQKFPGAKIVNVTFLSEQDAPFARHDPMGEQQDDDEE